MKVLFIAPNIDGQLAGEAFVAFKWAEFLSERVELTVLSFESSGEKTLSEQLPKARVVTRPQLAWVKRMPRLNSMMKPGYPVWMRWVRRWIDAALLRDEHFDLAHQIMPLAMRFPTPLRGHPFPYVMGPLGGTIETPPGFRHEMASARWFTRLRAFDKWRLAYDPLLRRSYEGAGLIMVVAPYAAERLAHMSLKRCEVLLELGIDDVPEPSEPRTGPGLRLLHVGRGVRTKALRDVVRAMGQMKDLPELTLISAGGGEEIEICRAEAEALGVADRITFEGQVSRARVDDLYRSSDVFVFPSFREPTGNVFFEAMSYGLPIISAAYGGPDYIVDESTGIKLPITTPEALANDIATAVRRLYHDPDLRARLGAGGRARLAREGLWSTKADRVMDLYREVMDTSGESA